MAKKKIPHFAKTNRNSPDPKAITLVDVKKYANAVVDGKSHFDSQLFHIKNPAKLTKCILILSPDWSDPSATVSKCDSWLGQRLPNLYNHLKDANLDHRMDMFDLKPYRVPTLGDYQTHFLKDPMIIVKKFMFLSALESKLEKKELDARLAKENASMYDWSSMILSEWEKSLVDEYVSSSSSSSSLAITKSKKRARDEDENEESHFPDDPKIFALDCEMILTESGSELARVSIVSEKDMKVVYDEFVRPANRVLDYKTPYSGITEEILSSKAHKSLEDVQKDIFSLAPPQSSILIGHSIENDLKALKLTCYPFLVDTSSLYANPSSMFKKPGLKWLAVRYLNRDETWQNHDSVEDAKATLELALLKRANGPSFGREKFNNIGNLVSRVKYLNLEKRVELVVPDPNDQKLIKQLFPDIELNESSPESHSEVDFLIQLHKGSLEELDKLVLNLYSEASENTLIIVSDTIRHGLEKDLYEILFSIPAQVTETDDKEDVVGSASVDKDEEDEEENDGWITVTRKSKKRKTSPSSSSISVNSRADQEKRLLDIGIELMSGKSMFIIKT